MTIVPPRTVPRTAGKDGDSPRGRGLSCFIIAEFGSSPAPDWDLGRWCLEAARSGADAVKVQLFCADHFPEAEQAGKRPLEFPREQFFRYVDAAHARGLQAGASVFDVPAVALAAAGGDFLKLAAREQAARGLLLRVAATTKPFYRSIDHLGVGVQMPQETTLFTRQQYPAPLWPAIMWLWRSSRFFKSHQLRWGWSSHTRSAFDCILAARLGALAVEKHFALERTNLEAGHSLLPDQFQHMAERIHAKK